jgi:hypothetical protein
MKSALLGKQLAEFYKYEEAQTDKAISQKLWDQDM